MTRSEQQATLLTFISLVMIGIGWLLMPPVSIKSQQSADKAMTEALQLLAPAPPVPEDIPTPEAPTAPAPITPEPVIEAPTVMVKYFRKEFKLLSLKFPYVSHGFGNSAPS
jgi:hypothetical protein